jgi:hypothetical protein
VQVSWLHLIELHSMLRCLSVLSSAAACFARCNKHNHLPDLLVTVVPLPSADDVLLFVNCT